MIAFKHLESYKTHLPLVMLVMRSTWRTSSVRSCLPRSDCTHPGTLSFTPHRMEWPRTLRLATDTKDLHQEHEDRLDMTWHGITDEETREIITFCARYWDRRVFSHLMTVTCLREKLLNFDWYVVFFLTICVVRRQQSNWTYSLDRCISILILCI